MADAHTNPLEPAPKQKASAERPTIGRIVHVQLPGQDPLAAIVTRVNEDGTIEASIFQPREGQLTPIHRLRHESVTKDGDPSWRWPFRS